jgi:hypothetical protein
MRFPRDFITLNVLPSSAFDIKSKNGLHSFLGN